MRKDPDPDVFAEDPPRAVTPRRRIDQGREARRGEERRRVFAFPVTTGTLVGIYARAWARRKV